MNQTFKTYSDMGSVKIFTDDVSLFFPNGYGDGENNVMIYDEQNKHLEKNNEFVGHFTVKTKAHLSEYDCKDAPIFTFKLGRWFVYRDADDGRISIAWTDAELRS